MRVWDLLSFEISLSIKQRTSEVVKREASVAHPLLEEVNLPTRNVFGGGERGFSGKSSFASLEVRFTQSQLSESRRQLIRAILDNHEETFFLSSREMAKRYKVDAATIVRTIQALGYERFADFAADLRQHFVKQITPYTVLKAATQEKLSVTDQVRQCLERDTESLSVLRSSLNADRVVEIAKLIH